MKVSLFPFLPVLLCMMGSMIMLLVLVAWNVQEQANHPIHDTMPTLTIEEAEQLRSNIEASIEEANWFTKNFTLAKQQAEEEFADIQARLAFAERETQRVREELARLEQLARQLDSPATATPEDVAYLQRLLTQQRQRQAEAELELAELQQEIAQMERSFAIVPSRRADGTFRRPIFIECRDNRIIIQPEGVELFPGDFQMLDRPDNPFASVLRVIHQYYVETGQLVRGSEPYPLLIVRPSGVEMFDKARHAAMETVWIRDFGYEIVSEDWHIHYPEPNDELRRRIIQQLEIAPNRLSGYMLARPMAQPAGRFGVDHRGNVAPMGGGDGRRQMADGSRADGNWAEPQAALPVGVPEHAGVSPPASPHPPQHQHQQQDQHQQQPQPQPHSPQAQPQRPQNWALRGATQFTTGISRTVIIRCEADRFVLVVQPGLRMEQAIPIAGSVASAADQLVQAIWEFQESWGSAGENMHWRPILQVRVTPGSERRLQELKFHLQNSGLLIE
jgi:hypothetical protein